MNSAPTTSANLERVRELAPDLRAPGKPPRSPRERLGGYVLAARAVDKCRADLVGQAGEYHTNCPLDQMWLKYAKIDYQKLRDYIATGASDEEVDRWIRENSHRRTSAEIIQWNNQQRDMDISGLPMDLQIYLEEYIPQCVPKGRVVYRFLDVYDLEEGRL